MNFIVTGGAGFIGSHLVEKLLCQGHKVTVIDDESTGSIQNLNNVLGHQNLLFIPSDVRNVSCWDELLAKDTTIIHLAGTVGVNRVVMNPLETIQNNFAGTKMLLDLAVKFSCRFFFASTSEVYGESGQEQSSESDALVINGTHCGRTSYILSKLLSEHYCINYFEQHGLPVIVGRFFNVIGTRQVSTFGMVTPTFVRQALTDESITIFGDGSQTRNFCDVDDVTNCILLLLQEEKAYGQVVNLGGNENITILELASYIKRSAGSQSPLVFVPFPKQRSEGRDIHHRSPCLLNVKSLTGWQPSIPWQRSIDRIVEQATWERQCNVMSLQREGAIFNLESEA